MWDDLKLEIDMCAKCVLEKIRIKPIIGEGSKNADILFVLDSISEEEDNKQKLLADKNGEYFKKFLEYSHGNLIDEDSILKCHEFLIAQIALINPKYVVTVGERATRFFLQNMIKEDIRNLVGQMYDFYGEIKIVPIYDISYLFKATDKEKWKLIKILEKL